MKFILSKKELLIAIAIAIVVSVLFWNFLSKVPIGLADPKPKLPPMEKNRIYHPKCFSIVAPQGWKSFIETGGKRNFNRIWSQPDIDARWSPKLIASIYNIDENPYYAMDPNDYQSGRYLEFDAQFYEGLWHDYHGWHAVFSHQGKNYSVLLMLPHGHGPPRYDKVPDYWWPFLNSFRIETKLGVEITKEGTNE